MPDKKSRMAFACRRVFVLQWFPAYSSFGDCLRMHNRKGLVAGLFITCTCLAQSVPPTTAKALDGSAVTFPTPQSQKPLLVLVGFSHKSSADFKEWNQRILSPYLNDPRIDYYELADLQGVPSLIRTMILHGMRREVPKAQHSHFAPLTAGEEDWKKPSASWQPRTRTSFSRNPPATSSGRQAALPTTIRWQHSSRL